MRKRNSVASAIAAAIILTTSTAAFAQAGTSGWYAGGTLGQSKVDIEGCGGGVSCDEKDSTWRILAGYQLNRNFAAELGFHELGEGSASGAGGSVNFKSNAFELLGVGMLPMGSQLALYGKAGIFRGETKVSGSTVITGPISLKETSTGLTFGFGGQYDFNRQIGLRLEWQRYTDMGDENSVGESDVDVLSVGVIVRF